MALLHAASSRLPPAVAVVPAVGRQAMPQPSRCPASCVHTWAYHAPQLKCWLMPGEEDERRRQIEEEKKTAAPPIMAQSASHASMAGSEASAAGPPPGRAPSLARRSGVASRYASAGVFGAAPSASSSEAGGGGSVLGGLRPSAGLGGGAPAMFKPPSGVFTPAAPAEVRMRLAASSAGTACGNCWPWRLA